MRVPVHAAELDDGGYASTWQPRASAARGPFAYRGFTVDTAKPAPRLLGSRAQPAGDAVGVTVACGDEACKAVASGTVSVPGASRVYRLKRARKTVAAGRKVKLSLGVPRKARRAIRAALADRVKVTARISVRVTDKAGNARTRRRSVKLTR